MQRATTEKGNTCNEIFISCLFNKNIDSKELLSIEEDTILNNTTQTLLTLPKEGFSLTTIISFKIRQNESKSKNYKFTLIKCLWKKN